MLVVLTCSPASSIRCSSPASRRSRSRAQANGSLIAARRQGVGLRADRPAVRRSEYFWSRPSATAPMPYNGGASSGSNHGPLNPALADAVEGARSRRCATPIPDNTAPVPVDLVTASGSGLDPHISAGRGALPGRPRRQARGVARRTRCARWSTQHTEGRTLGVLGEPRVNVLRAQPRARRAWRGRSAAVARRDRDRARATPSAPIPTQLLAQVQARGARERARPAEGSSSALARASARPTRCSRRRARCATRGVDVVVGVVETHGRKETAALLAGPRGPAAPGASSTAASTLERVRPRRRARAQPRADPGRRARAHQRARLAPPEALAGRRRAARRRHRRLHDAQRPAPREPERRRRRHHRRHACARPCPTRSSTRPTRSMLVDSRADELLERLREGKVYVPEQAERARRRTSSARAT